MRKINWGVLGTAGIAKGQTIPGMQQAENCNLYAIAGRSETKVNEFKEEDGNLYAIYGTPAESLTYKFAQKTAKRFGEIKGKYVIYRGETTEVNGIKYVNAEEYLKTLA